MLSFSYVTEASLYCADTKIHPIQSVLIALQIPLGGATVSGFPGLFIADLVVWYHYTQRYLSLLRKKAMESNIYQLIRRRGFPKKF